MQRTMRLTREYKLLLLNQADTLRSPERVASPISLNYRLKLKDINPLLNLLGTGIKISPTVMQGYLTGGEVSEFTMLTSIDTLKRGRAEFYHTNIDLYASIITDAQPYAKVELKLFSERQNFSNLTELEALQLKVDWNHDQILFD
ncbi:MAG: hypothetical protein HC842_09700, partial [Cytophagales bacterium]|nr:hypothetical protein [Cytophagales bacterium]